MIILFAILSLPIVFWLPWWIYPAIAAAFGFWARASWKTATGFALLVALLEILLSYTLDLQAHGLISRRVAGVFSAPGWTVYLIQAFIGSWVAFFGFQFGGSIRALFRPGA